MILSFERVKYYSLILFAFTLPLSRAAISFFIVWFFLLVLFKVNYKDSLKILKENSIFIYIFIFLGYLYLTLIWTDDFSIGSRQARMLAYWLMLLPSLVILIQKKWLYSILNTFLLGMLISELLTYGMFFELWSINGRGAEYPTPFMSHIHYSIFLAFTSLILLYRVLFEKNSLKYKIPMFIFFILTTVNLMISTGRTGQLAFFVTLFVVFFLKYRSVFKTIVFASLVMLSVFLVSYNSLSPFKNRVALALEDIKNINTQDYNSSFGIRVIYWKISYDALKEEPILGYGLGDYSIAIKNMIEKNNYKGINNDTKDFLIDSHLHNQYLMILVQGGIVGLFLMLLLFYKLFRLKIDDLEMKHISIIGLSVIIVSMVAEPLWILQFPLVLFLFIVSISIVASKKE